MRRVGPDRSDGLRPTTFQPDWTEGFDDRSRARHHQYRPSEGPRLPVESAAAPVPDGRPPDDVPGDRGAHHDHAPRPWPTSLPPATRPTTFCRRSRPPKACPTPRSKVCWRTTPRPWPSRTANRSVIPRSGPRWGVHSQDLANLLIAEKLVPAQKASPNQWRTWWLICLAGQAVFALLVFTMKGRWEPEGSPARPRGSRAQRGRRIGQGPS